MPDWTPAREWDKADAFIIGGGPSLAGFDFSLLKGRKTIGCNNAFLHGVDVCNICFFSDNTWFTHQFNGRPVHLELADYSKAGGRVFTHSSHVRLHDMPFVHFLPRKLQGLHRDALGFGGNSGCGAINLALIMGARRVFLLGMDCKSTDGKKQNYHDRARVKPSADLYAKFRKGFVAISKQLQAVFPESKIINLGPDSALECFPKADWRDYLKHNGTHN